MSKEQFLSLVRMILTLAGSFLLGKMFFGEPLGSATLNVIFGIVLSLAGVLWAVFTKTVTAEMVQSLLWQIGIFAAGILLARGVITNDVYLEIIGILGALLPLAQSKLNRSKNKDIATGTISTSQLDGVVKK